MGRISARNDRSYRKCAGGHGWGAEEGSGRRSFDKDYFQVSPWRLRRTRSLMGMDCSFDTAVRVRAQRVHSLIEPAGIRFAAARSDARHCYGPLRKIRPTSVTERPKRSGTGRVTRGFADEQAVWYLRRRFTLECKKQSTAPGTAGSCNKLTFGIPAEEPQRRLIIHSSAKSCFATGSRCSLRSRLRSSRGLP